jgi:L,D-transpeptidase YcbB
MFSVALIASALLAGALSTTTRPDVPVSPHLRPQTLWSEQARVVDSLLHAVIRSRRHAPQRWPRLDDVATDLERVYDSTRGTPIWTRQGRPTAAARAVIEQLATSDTRGLDPADFDVSRLRAFLLDSGGTTFSPHAQVDFEMTLSTGALRLLRSLHFGRVSATVAHPRLRFRRAPYEAGRVLLAMSASSNPTVFIDDAEPPFLHYRLLVDALARYRALSRDTSWRIAIRGTLHPDSTDAGVPALRRLLAALGDLPAGSVPVDVADSLRYDSVLVRGVRRYQERHALDADGVVGPSTVRWMQAPLSARVRQLELALERWRWLPHQLGDPPPIVVNIPAFRLYAFSTDRDREADLLSMDVVVGQAYGHKTPVFSAIMTHLVFSPFWDVPPRIARKELLPKARRDAGYLARNHFDVLGPSGQVLPPSRSALDAVAAGRARIRQRPGEDNALGGVKFVLPNEFNVYLHDTPAQSAFLRLRRDLSHGCVRLARPADLAQLLLRDQPAWDSLAIAAAMGQAEPREVSLTRPVPVHIMYGTTAVREDGTVRFYDDIYGHDRQLARLLTAGFPYPP